MSDRGFEAGCLFDLMPLGGLESGRVLGFVSDRGFEAGCPFLALDPFLAFVAGVDVIVEYSAFLVLCLLGRRSAV